MKKVAIIGGGPAGIFCAIKLLDVSNLDITIFEKNKPLLTLLPTGNGRCNLAYEEYNNMELAKFYPRGEKFLYSVFSRFGAEDTIYSFKNIGVETYVQEDMRIFPKENKSSFVRKKMLDYLYGKVKFKTQTVSDLPNGYDFYVIATGLKSDISFIENLGHKIVPIKPSLYGLKIKEKEFSTLKGVSLNGVIFTDYGVSGPFIYKLTSYNAYKNFPYEFEIPLLDPEKLKEEVKLYPKKLFKNVVAKFIPKGLAEILIKNEIQCANIKKTQIEALSTLKLTATSPDNRGEIVHAGGISLNSIDKNFKSKILDNIWFIGEVVDIDGLTGGFNLQNCWSSASIAAYDIISKI